ncbi:MAG: M24 family metallopeptidase [Eubacteriales bacterium]|nr:M24 family metallopeptidase [Eubacteriales bacterium]
MEVAVKNTAKRIEALCAQMRAAGIDYYLVTTADYHHSEYVAAYFCVREYLCGFSGSNGSLVIGEDFAGLWTDGRYWIQAQKELEGSGAALYKMGEPGVPTIPQFLAQRMESGMCLGFDGRCVTVQEARELEEAAMKAGKEITLRTSDFLADRIWEERPALPCHPMFVLPEESAGRSFADKLAALRGELEKRGAFCYLSGKLDELMWLTNLRGGDIECNPVALAYGYFSMEEAVLFVQEAEVTEEVREYAQGVGLQLRPYESFIDFLEKQELEGPVLLDPAQTGCAVRDAAQRRLATLHSVQEMENGECGKPVVGEDKFGGSCADRRSAGERRIAQDMTRDLNLMEGASPLSLPKAIKNETEIRNLKETYRQDSAAICRFLYWLERQMKSGAQGMTEVTASDYLDGLRAQLPGYLELSFPTISAYGANAAMMHYTATKENCAVLKPEGMLLVDSGGQYLTGTTDVTRTTALGPVTEQMRRHYTLTATGNLALLNAVFMEGCTGRNLDILCREPLWQIGSDYKCGTGHGIGYVLNVHEGPQSIRWRATKNRAEDETAIVPGMIVSDEPGVYVEGEYGIRIETILLCTEKMATGDGIFYGFEPLTFVPLDRTLLDPRYLNETDRKRLNDYHARVYQEIAPLLDEEERTWLKEQTREM